MVMAIAYEEAKRTNQIRKEGNDEADRKGGLFNTLFFGIRNMDPQHVERHLPEAFLSAGDPGRYSGAHFHVTDQFQVVVSGKGTVGRHDVGPYSVHFARAYTPYGPLLADSTLGMAHLTLRSHHDPETPRRLADAETIELLKRMTERRPWQVLSHKITFPSLHSAAAKDLMLQAIPEITGTPGLAAYTLSMRPGAKTSAPDPVHGDGQYVVVVKGSFWHDKVEHKALALAFVKPDEGAFQVCAGSTGLEAIILNFPPPKAPTNATPASTQTSNGEAWKCTMCAFVFDQATGLPGEGIVPGTHWQHLPDSWICPNCSSPKTLFKNA